MTTIRGVMFLVLLCAVPAALAQGDGGQVLCDFLRTPEVGSWSYAFPHEEGKFHLELGYEVQHFGFDEFDGMDLDHRFEALRHQLTVGGTKEVGDEKAIRFGVDVAYLDWSGTGPFPDGSGFGDPRLYFTLYGGEGLQYALEADVVMPFDDDPAFNLPGAAVRLGGVWRPATDGAYPHYRGHIGLGYRHHVEESALDAWDARLGLAMNPWEPPLTLEFAVDAFLEPHGSQDAVTSEREDRLLVDAVLGLTVEPNWPGGRHLFSVSLRTPLNDDGYRDDLAVGLSYRVTLEAAD